MASVRTLIQPLLWRLYKAYLSIPRWYKYDGLSIRVLPSVFHPGLLGSSKVLYQFIKNYSFQGKQVLELGAGAGLIALHIAKNGGQVVASDINPIALQSIQESCVRNNLEVTTCLSDLFDEIPKIYFDYIFINPPYYPGNPKSNREYAFYCGDDYQYFHKLFSQISAYLKSSSLVFMVLSKSVNINRIRKISTRHDLSLEKLSVVKQKMDIHYIFKILR